MWNYMSYFYTEKWELSKITMLEFDDERSSTAFGVEKFVK